MQISVMTYSTEGWSVNITVVCLHFFPMETCQLISGMVLTLSLQLIFPYPCCKDVCALAALRCMSVLLMPMKTKKAEGDVPFVLKFVPVS